MRLETALESGMACRQRFALTVSLLLAASAVTAAPPDVASAVDALAGMPGVETVAVERNGELLAAVGGNAPHNLKSLSKSLLSALVGIALDEGLFSGLDEPLSELLPDAHDWAADPAKGRITLGQLLTMTAGLEPTSGPAYGAWVTSPSWVTAALERPPVAAPGERFLYSTGNTHLLSAALTRASGVSTQAYASDRLLAPLGIRVVAWQRDPEGISFGGNNVSLRPHDLLAFGRLYLNQGLVGKRKLVPASWIAASTTAHSEGWPDRYGAYGYLWWVRPSGAYMAVGYGGQLLYVAPAQRLVVVVTSTLQSKGAPWDRRLIALLEERLLPATRP